MRHFLLLFSIAILSLPTQVLGNQVDDQDTPNLEIAAAERLSEEMIRVARMAAMSIPLDTTAISTAVVLVEEASKLAPNNESVWRAMIEVAQMADLDDLRRKAIIELSRLTPSDTSSQLMRLRGAIEQTNTVDHRMEVYEKLLSDGRSSLLDSRVASRLALDAALLQRQLGDINQFARWLAESVALDPYNPDAISLAAGFFGDESADIYRRAELLASVLLSNIRDTTTHVALAEYLMAFGDYEDAKVLYEIVLGKDAKSIAIISNGLLGDIVLSQWASGDIVAALDTLMERQKSVDKKFRKKTRAEQTRITPLELARIHAPLAPKLAAIRAAIYADDIDPAQRAITLDSAIGSILAMAKLYELQVGPDAEQVMDLHLQAAWIAIWLGSDVELAQISIDHVETISTISAEEKQRLLGWIALRSGKFHEARKLLEGLSDDPSARAGMGLVFLAEGNKQAAAKEFLEIARNQGGTLLGVWSRNQLLKIVGGPFNIRPEVSQLRDLMADVIQTLNSQLKDPRPAVSITVTPSQRIFKPYESLDVIIELKNNTNVPLTIAKNGPIQPLILIEPFLQITTASITAIPPIIIPIDRQLAIDPRETLVIRTNLREQWLGSMLNRYPLQGAIIELRSTVNFTARETKTNGGVSVLVYGVGRLGIQKKTDLFRIDGARLTDTWLKEAIEKASNVQTLDDLTSMVMLTYVVGDDIPIKIVEPSIPPPVQEEPDPTQESGRIGLQDDAITTILSSFPKLEKHAQSWVIATMSNDPSIEAIVGMMKDPDDALSQFVWMMRFVSIHVPDEALDDPRLLAALQSQDEGVRTVATWVYARVEQSVQRRAQELLGLPIESQ